MVREIVVTKRAPGAMGPYSQAIKTKDMVFVSGQLAIDPLSGELISEEIRKETRQALNNLKQILLAAGSKLDHVIKTTLYISNMDDFDRINEVYAEFFNQDPPARACIQVARLPKDANVEVEAVALL
jgi:2-iminobutanoate/2-iminopropanoate deaminase